MTQSKPVLCLGEALIDVVIRDDTRSEHVGGSPLNVACVITSLGRPALIGAWWGRDDHGKLIEDYAADHGVGVVPGSDGAAKTSLAYARLNDAGSAEYEFDLSWEVPPLPAPEAIAHLHTGSLAATLEPGGTQVLEAVRAMSQVGTVSYDPNARPAIMESPDKSRGRVEELVALADVVKVSDEDIDWLTGGASIDEVVDRWLGMGPSLVVVTRGKHGSLAVTSSGLRFTKTPSDVKVVDTVGAGDSFMGGMIDAMWGMGLRGADAREALRSLSEEQVRAIIDRASAVSDVTVSRKGANPPWAHELP